MAPEPLIKVSGVLIHYLYFSENKANVQITISFQSSLPAHPPHISFERGRTGREYIQTLFSPSEGGHGRDSIPSPYFNFWSNGKVTFT